MIAITNLTIAYGGVIALNDVTTQITSSVCGIIGPNGAGKTTFLNAMSGFVTPKTGTIGVDDTDITGWSPHARARWGLRRSFQKEDVVDELTVAENVAIQLDACGMVGQAREKEISRVLEFVGLTEFALKRAAELTSLQRRMTEIARCLSGQPKVIMLDEPGAGFSQGEIKTLQAVIAGIESYCGARTLLIDHDVDLIRATCSDTIVFDFGTLVATGPTAEVLEDDRVRAVYLGLEAGE